MTTIEDPPAGSVHPAAAALIAARRRGVTVPAVDPGDAASAYRVQREVDAALFDRDGAPRAWKSGGASREAPRTHAPLPPGGVRASPADLRDLRVSLRRIEAEVALRLARDVDAATAAGIGAGDAAAIVDAMAAAIELVDSRWAEGLDAPPFARLADLQSHGALVLGEWVPFAPRDWSAQRCVVRIGEAPALERIGTHPLGDPAQVLGPWLRHATADGATVRAGTIVTTGSWCGMPAARAGDRVEVAFDGIGAALLGL